MTTTLKEAERGRALKVTEFAERLGPFGLKLLAGMGIKKGAELEIDPAFVSNLVLGIQGTTVQIGFESAMGIVLGGKRLTDLKVGETGIITALELGRESAQRFVALGFAKGANVSLEKYVPGPGPLFISVQKMHIAIVNLEGFVLIRDELYDYELPGEFVFVDIDGKEKQLCTMSVGERGKITRILGGEDLTAELDRHWIKEGNEVQALHRSETPGDALMVWVIDERHHIPTGLTEKIYVDIV
ncbi:MAG: hypothetical protein BA865_09385 [Desulfobacterales bacterium S5133MH4]|nr:MAG: hypothetical protein BA865_09385 [Desulfobacterales bacterium S5133MH4]